MLFFLNILGLKIKICPIKYKQNYLKCQISERVIKTFLKQAGGFAPACFNLLLFKISLFRFIN